MIKDSRTSRVKTKWYLPKDNQVIGTAGSERKRRERDQIIHAGGVHPHLSHEDRSQRRNGGWIALQECREAGSRRGGGGGSKVRRILGEVELLVGRPQLDGTALAQSVEQQHTYKQKQQK